MIEVVIQYVLSPVMAAGAGFLVYLAKERRSTDNSCATGIMLLLRREIIDLHKKHVIDGDPIDKDEFTNISEVYSCYKALGGNSLADKLYHELDEIKITEA